MKRYNPRHPLYVDVAVRANHLCEYCRAPEELSTKEFHVEHVTPRARGGRDELANLALACFRCNPSKYTALSVEDPQTGRRIPLYNPRAADADWSSHLEFVVLPDEERVLIGGKDEIGLATIQQLGMNAPHATRARWHWFLYYLLRVGTLPG